MTKEEILARSRNEKKDEGTEYIASRGRRWGVAAMSLMYLALISIQLVQWSGQLPAAGGVLGVSGL